MINFLNIIIGPSLMIIGGIVTWIIKSKIEELQAIEKSLLDERRKIYYDLLSPYIEIFAIEGNKEKAMKDMLSTEYRKTSFNLNLIGSDNVVNAYNEMMQYTFKTEKLENTDPKQLMILLANFLLEIRKSLGNKKTTLNNIDMLKSMIKDIDKIENTN